jgi:hypothetical protein
MKIILLLFLSIPCFSQDSYAELVKFKRNAPAAYEAAVSDSIRKLTSSDLGNFLYHIQLADSRALRAHNELLYEKLKHSNWPLDLYMITGILVDQYFDLNRLSETLNQKKSIWDKGEWAARFWTLIREKDLGVAQDAGYSVDRIGNKLYDVAAFIELKIAIGEIGENPLLLLDGKPTAYEPGQLVAFLSKLDIKDINVPIVKEKAPNLYGRRGIDGVIAVLTR